jgi:hypothetical protein
MNPFWAEERMQPELRLFDSEREKGDRLGLALTANWQTIAPWHWVAPARREPIRGMESPTE